MINNYHIIRIAAQCGHDPRTVAKAYQGGRTHAGTWHRIVAAARALGLPEPPRR